MNDKNENPNESDKLRVELIATSISTDNFPAENLIGVIEDALNGNIDALEKVIEHAKDREYDSNFSYNESWCGHEE